MQASVHTSNDPVGNQRSRVAVGLLLSDWNALSYTALQEGCQGKRFLRTFSAPNLYG